MRKLYLILFYFSFSLFNAFILSLEAHGQGGTWTWISGDTTVNAVGVFGTKGTPSVNNHPQGMTQACEWKDKKGNFWIYGGQNDPGLYANLWKFNPVTTEWTWVKGNSNYNPVYGTKGAANAANSPGGRVTGSATWVDTTGDLWLFGGNGQNDLWRYQITTNNWTWMSGDSTNTPSGNHGVKGVASSTNVPGGRNETASAWTDSLNNLWLFGGDGYDDYGTHAYLNDLMKYNIATNMWTWVKGSNTAGVLATYGTQGTASASNDPGSRETYTKWKDSNGNFWIMGGWTYNPCCYQYRLNDVWKYDVTTGNWTWMYGSSTPNDAGNYQNTCASDKINMPYARWQQRSAVTDECGRFWLFGGAFFVSSPQELNDLWVFDPKQVKWEWVSGSNVPNLPGSYGTLGVASPSNIPGSRMGASAWWGNDHKFYLFGGLHKTLPSAYCDMWVFTPDTACIPSCSMLTGVDELSNKSIISIFPNPSNGRFMIHLLSRSSDYANGRIEIYNTFGAKVFEEIFTGATSKEIYLKNISSGIYLVKVIVREKNYTQKVIINQD